MFSSSENQILPAHLTAQRQTVVSFLPQPVISDKVIVLWHMDMAYVLKIKSYIKHGLFHNYVIQVKECGNVFPRTPPQSSGTAG